jgi:hypothetical protein
MTINTTQLRSFIGPVWQEISSLWSGVEFSFSDAVLDSAGQPEPVLSSTTIARDAHFQTPCITEVSQLLGQR